MAPDYPDSLERRMSKDTESSSLHGAAEKIDLLPSPPPTYPGNAMPITSFPGGSAVVWADKDVGRIDTPSTPSPAVEWVTCAIFDVGLLFLEVIVSVILALSLKDEGFVSYHHGIVGLLAVPCLLNAVMWLRVGPTTDFNFLFVLGITFFGFPSPVIVYIWVLYLSIFGRKEDAVASKFIANNFRIVQAFCCSIPLVLLNLYTLFNELKMIEDSGKEALNLAQLSNHVDEVKIHGLSFVISFLNIVRAVSLFNERQTHTILFVMIAFPFIFLSALSRLIGFGIIISFLDPKWIVVLILCLFIVNIILYLACRKNKKSDDDSFDSFQRRSAFCGCDNSDPDSWLNSLPQTIVLSVCSMIVPLAYANDHKSKHPVIKGGVFILLNYLFNMVLICGALGLTILHYVPNTFHGVALPQPSLQVQVPDSKVFLQAGGMDIALNLPNTHMDLGSMPSVEVSLHTDSSDFQHSIMIPLIVAMFSIPFVIMRASMSELDCFLARRKDLEAPTTGQPLRNAVVQSANDRRLKARMYVTICCSMGGMCIFTMFMMMTGAFIFMSMH